MIVGDIDEIVSADKSGMDYNESYVNVLMVISRRENLFYLFLIYTLFRGDVDRRIDYGSDFPW